MGRIHQADLEQLKTEFIGKRDVLRLDKNPYSPDYLIAGEIASGGTSRLFKANREALFKGDVLRYPQSLVVKLLDSSMLINPAIIERFLREGELLCSMNHPNLVRAYGQGSYNFRADKVSDGTQDDTKAYSQRRHRSNCSLPFTVLEYIDGETLASLLARTTKLPLRHTFSIIRDILLALDYLYLDGRAQAHRDVKPANIMLSVNGATKLIDLGVAKTSLRIAHRLDTDFLGSIHYVAPEQIDDASRADIRSDIYALGAVFYESCAGKRAFTGTKRSQILAAHLMGNTPQLPEKGEWSANKALREICTEILEKTLAVDTLNRFQTPSEFLEAVNYADTILDGCSNFGRENKIFKKC